MVKLWEITTVYQVEGAKKDSRGFSHKRFHMKSSVIKDGNRKYKRPKNLKQTI